MNARFMLSAASAEQFPAADMKEICFAGRSNAGKSSMINKILERKKLAKTGNTPGKTRLVNFSILTENIYLPICQVTVMRRFPKGSGRHGAD